MLRALEGLIKVKKLDKRLEDKMFLSRRGKKMEMALAFLSVPFRVQ